MNESFLQDRLSWGLNIAARHIGIVCDAYRPNGPNDPLNRRHRFLRLPVAFCPVEGRFARSNRYGNAVWEGILDTSYIFVGDYLVRADGTWFVADCRPLLPLLCVLTNRTISISQQRSGTTIGASEYSGLTAGSTTSILTKWPASVLGAGSGGLPEADLPADSTVPYWTVLLPSVPDIVITPSDILTDDLGRNAVVSSAELTSLGWRLSVKQATT
jgi:hypothetical protein